MSLIGTFQVGLNALQGQSRAMGVISENIANVATDGYKRFQTQFTTLVTPNQQRGGSVSASRVTGHGIAAHSRQNIGFQGPVRPTGRDLDLAISGRGFFMVAPSFGTEPHYTRAGSFEPEVRELGNGRSELFLVNEMKSRLMGWDVRRGGASGPPQPIRFELDENGPEIPARPTSRILYDANLPSSVAEQDDIDRSTPDTIDLPVSRIKFYDDQGNLREFRVQWRKLIDQTGTPPLPRENTWEATFYAENSAKDDFEGRPRVIVGGGAAGIARRFVFAAGSDPSTGLEAGSVLSISDPADPSPLPGPVGAPASLALPIAFGQPPGATVSLPNPQTVRLDFGRFGKTGGLTQVAQPFIEASQTQDGYPAGEYVGMRFDDGGNILVKYSNGLEIPSFRLAFATFDNDEGVSLVKGSEFRATQLSGTPRVYGATDVSIGRGSPVGKLVPGGVEGSNAEIEKEFANLIVTQRAYSAASKIVQTVDQMAQVIRDL